MIERLFFNGIDMDGAGISIGNGVELAIINPPVMAIAQFTFFQGALVRADLAADAPRCFHLVECFPAPFPGFFRRYGIKFCGAKKSPGQIGS